MLPANQQTNHPLPQELPSLTLLAKINPYPYDAEDGCENSDPTLWVERVWRGGPWSNGYWWLRSTVRYRSIPSYWYVNLGIRCGESD
jgi:formylglycine-generating enzyme required for sulfatase activity